MNSFRIKYNGIILIRVVATTIASIISAQSLCRRKPAWRYLKGSIEEGVSILIIENSMLSSLCLSVQSD